MVMLNVHSEILMYDSYILYDRTLENEKHSSDQVGNSSIFLILCLAMVQAEQTSNLKQRTQST